MGGLTQTLEAVGEEALKDGAGRRGSSNTQVRGGLGDMSESLIELG